MTYLLIIAILLLAALVLPAAVLSGMLSWHHLQTRGLQYFGKPAAERAQFREKLAARRWLVEPQLRALRRSWSPPNRFAIDIDGVRAPGNTCDAESFASAKRYRPTSEDVFVATQMKCGTTWVLQIVFEILERGEGDLSDDGYGHLHAMSPWIESFNGVSMSDAPLVGKEGKRVIKTHLPAELCPYGEEARYVYVTRHPVSCYRSCVDFFDAVAGPLSPERATALDWFCSDAMWWGSWPNHVAGFWEWARERENVLFLHFEDLKADLPGAIRQIAEFLSVSLSDDELQRVADKAGFQYMKEREALFEMMPPSFFSVGETFFKRGGGHENEPVTAAERRRIAEFCRERLESADYPLREKYPDLFED